MSPSVNTGPRLVGWRLVGTDRWWPAMFGPPPSYPSLTWEPMLAPSEAARKAEREGET